MIDEEYWDDVAKKVISNNSITNYYKISEICGRCLQFEMWGKTVLEVGAGLGVVAQHLKSLVRIKYTATEISKVYCDFGRSLNLDYFYTNSCDLPGKDCSADYIFAFDALEHIHPDSKPKLYHEIGRCLKHNGIMLINNPSPYTVSHHNENVEHGFNLEDLSTLIDVACLELVKIELYGIKITTTKGTDYRKYEWMVLQKRPPQTS